MTEKVLLELILLLLACIAGILGYGFRRHDRLHEVLAGAIESLKEQRGLCNEAFATKESVRRAHLRIDENEATLGTLATRVTRLEANRECLHHEP